MKRNFTAERTLSSSIGAVLSLVFLILSPLSSVAVRTDTNAYAKTDAHQSISLSPDKPEVVSKHLQLDDGYCFVGSSCHVPLLLMEVRLEDAQISFKEIALPERGHFAEGFREDVTTPPPLTIRA